MIRVKAGLIGRGIGKSLSPALHMREGRMLGLDYSYELFDLDVLDRGSERLKGVIDDVAARGLVGCNVTFPVKQAVLPLLDRINPHAAAMGSVNTVVFGEDGAREGFNTDWWGFAENFRRTLPEAELSTVVLLGAGGVGAAAGYALGRMGCKRTIVVDADRTRARELAERLHHLGFVAEPAPVEGLEDALAEADGLVQATPLGMTGHPGSPVPANVLQPALWVAEIVYVPIETELLRTARAIGCATVDGGGMVVLQAARAFELFTGLVPDEARMKAHLVSLLAEQPA